MDREQAKLEIKSRFAEYLRPAKKRGTYICPLCGNGSGSMPEGALNNGTVGENPADSRNDADTSSDAARAGRTSTCTTEGETLFRPASYRQMLRNARVHDLDGDLTDGENSVTPGVLH